MHKFFLTLSVFAALLAGCSEAPSNADKPKEIATATEPTPSLAIAQFSDSLAITSSKSCPDPEPNICFVDNDGNEAYWIYEAYKRGGPEMETYSAEIMRRQRRYNDWYAHLSRSGPLTESHIFGELSPDHIEEASERSWTGAYLTIPDHIRETGRLDLDTIAIPYYQAVYKLLDEAQLLRRDCEHDYADRDESYRLACRPTADQFADLDILSPRAAGTNQRFDALFLLRVAALRNAFEKSALYGGAVEAVLRSLHLSDQQLHNVSDVRDLWIDGFDPDQLSATALDAVEVAELQFTVALEEVQWSATAYHAAHHEQQGSP